MKNTLQTLQKKRKSKKGFTLMEMLIVVAIIAILVAIAIPVFSAQLTDAKKQVQDANKRSAKSMAVTQYLLDKDTDGANYYAVVDNEGNMVIKSSEPTTSGYKYYTVIIASNGTVDSVSDLKTAP